MTDPQPTLLIFTLGAEAESRRRRLLPECWRQVEVGLRREVFDRVLTAGRRAGCRVVVSSPRPLDEADAEHLPQVHGSFGHRLERALEACLSRHGGPVVVVGTDIPGLEARHLEAALRSLEDDPNRVVLGPSPDGGFYLLATRCPIPSLASAVRWCCPSTLESLTRTLAAHGRPLALLKPLSDLDRPADLERWLAEAPCLTPGERSVLRLLAVHRRPLEPSPVRPPLPAEVWPRPARAPPSSVAA